MGGCSLRCGSDASTAAYFETCREKKKVREPSFLRRIFLSLTRFGRNEATCPILSPAVRALAWMERRCVGRWRLGREVGWRRRAFASF